MPRIARNKETATNEKTAKASANGAPKGRPGRKPKSLDANTITPLSLAGSSAGALDGSGLQAILTQTESALAQLIEKIDSLEKQLHELESLRTQRQQLESLKASIHLLIAPTTGGRSKGTQSTKTAALTTPLASTASAKPESTDAPKRRGRKPNALKLLEAANAETTDAPKKRGPGRPKTVGRKVPKNIGKGNYIFIPELAIEQSKETIKRRESVNFEMFKAIVLNGGIASSEEIRTYLIEQDIRQPNKDNASFEDVALTDISSRISYLVTKGAVQPRGKGVFASSYGWQKGDGTKANTPTMAEVSDASPESDETHAPEREEALV